MTLAIVIIPFAGLGSESDPMRVRGCRTASIGEAGRPGGGGHFFPDLTKGGSMKGFLSARWGASIVAFLVPPLLQLEPGALAGPPPYSMNCTVGPSARAVAAGDFTGDGWLDLAVACNDRTEPEVSLLVGTGEGRFAGSFPCIQWVGRIPIRS
jgi:hypothetical protein